MSSTRLRDRDRGPARTIAWLRSLWRRPRDPGADARPPDATGAPLQPTAAGLFTARSKPQSVDMRPRSVSDRAMGAHPRRALVNPGAPDVRIHEDVVATPAPPQHLTPSQALHLARGAVPPRAHPDADGGSDQRTDRA